MSFRALKVLLVVALGTQSGMQPAQAQPVASFDPETGQFELRDGGELRLVASVSLTLHGKALAPDSLESYVQFSQEEHVGPAGAVTLEFRWTCANLPEASVVLQGEITG